MKNTFFLLLSLLITLTAFSQEDKTSNTGTFTDQRDSIQYNWVKIGNQIWMAENLAFKADSGCWAYDNDIANVSEYGYLYDWETAKNVCPSSWHLPTKDEFETLLANYGEERSWHNAEAYTALIKGGNSGFYALLGGWRNSHGRFSGKGKADVFWAATGQADTNAWHIDIGSTGKKVGVYSWLYKDWWYPVRCLLDSEK